MVRRGGQQQQTGRMQASTFPPPRGQEEELPEDFLEEESDDDEQQRSTENNNAGSGGKVVDKEKTKAQNDEDKNDEMETENNEEEEEEEQENNSSGGDGATDSETEDAPSEDAPSSSNASSGKGKKKKRGRPPAKKQQQKEQQMMKAPQSPPKKKEQPKQQKKIYTIKLEVVFDKIVRRDEENSEFEIKFRPLPNQMIPIDRMERDYPDLVSAFEQAKKTNNKRKQDLGFEVSLDEPPKAKGIRSSQRQSPKKNLPAVRTSSRAPVPTNFFLVESSKRFETEDGTRKRRAKSEGSDTESGESYVVEKILAERVVNGRSEYKTRWEGYGSDADTWQSYESVKDLDEYRKFKERQQKEGEHSGGAGAGTVAKKGVEKKPVGRGRPPKSAAKKENGGDFEADEEEASVEGSGAKTELKKTVPQRKKRGRKPATGPKQKQSKASGGDKGKDEDEEMDEQEDGEGEDSDGDPNKEYVVEEALDAKRVGPRDTQWQFFIKWEGYGPEHNSWEPYIGLKGVDCVEELLAKKLAEEEEQKAREGKDDGASTSGGSSAVPNEQKKKKVPARRTRSHK